MLHCTHILLYNTIWHTWHSFKRNQYILISFCLKDSILTSCLFSHHQFKVFVLWCNCVLTIGCPTRLSRDFLSEMWAVNQCVRSFFPVVVSAFLKSDLQQAGPCLSQCPACYNLVISKDSLWMDSTDCNWCGRLHSLSNLCMNPAVCPQCVVSMLLMCTSDTTALSGYLPQSVTSCTITLQQKRQCLMSGLKLFRLVFVI